MGDGRQTHVWGTNRASAGLTDNGNGLAADECQRGGWRLRWLMNWKRGKRMDRAERRD